MLNCFKRILDKYWSDQDTVYYDFRAEIQRTGGRSEATVKTLIIISRY